MLRDEIAADLQHSLAMARTCDPIERNYWQDRAATAAEDLCTLDAMNKDRTKGACKMLRDPASWACFAAFCFIIAMVINAWVEIVR